MQRQHDLRFGHDHVIAKLHRDFGQFAARGEEGGGEDRDCTPVPLLTGTHRNDTSTPSVGRKGIIDTPERVGGSGSKS